MDTLIRNLRVACRQLGRQKLFLLTVVPTLALCIGANATLFALVDRVLLRPLPFPDSGRLVTMWNAYPEATGGDTDGSNGAPDYFDRRALTDVFVDVAAYDTRGRNLGSAGGALRLNASTTTPSLFGLLGADAAIGRTFLESEAEPGAGKVAVLSDGLWQEAFGQREVIGAEIRLDGESHVIVGVMPPGFAFPNRGVRVWTPLAFTSEQREQYHNNSWNMIARLQPGVPIERAQAAVDALNLANKHERYPEVAALVDESGFHTPVRGLQDVLVRDLRAALYLLWAGVACVLVIGAVNVANLLLLRASARSREFATRIAVGASSSQVAGQLATEAAVLCVVGTLLGLVVASGALHLIGRLELVPFTYVDQLQVNGRVVVFTTLVAVGVTLLVALLPAFRVRQVSPATVFSQQGRGGTADRQVRLARHGLVVAQVALALVLLAGTGALMASFRSLLSVNPGFDASGVATAQVSLPASTYGDDDARRAFADRVLERVRSVPGVVSAAFTTQVPFGADGNYSVLFPEGYVPQPGESAVSPAQVAVSPALFEALGIRVLAGRAFEPADVAAGRRVTVLDQRLARRFWPDGDAVGRRVWLPTSPESFLDPSLATYVDVVGVVAPVLMRGTASLLDRVGTAYFPLAQDPRDSIALVLRTDGDPLTLMASVRRAVADVDPEIPLFDVRTLDDRIGASLSDRRTLVLVTSGFGLLALLLATLGLYGVLASLVQQRTREIGIRMALGSGGRAIAGLVLGEGAAMLGVGLVLGLAGVIAMRRVLEGHLHDVSPLDPAVLLLAAGLMTLAACVASLIPALRAARVNPAEVLARGV